MNVQELIDFLLVKFPDNTTGAITPQELREGLAEFANRNEVQSDSPISIKSIIDEILIEAATLLTLRSLNDSVDIISIDETNRIKVDGVNGEITMDVVELFTLLSNNNIRVEALNKIENLVFGGQVKITQDGADLSIKLEVSPTEYIRIANGDTLSLNGNSIELNGEGTVYLQGINVSMNTAFGQVECSGQGVMIRRTGGQYIRFGNVPVFADHATADASVLSESIYKLTGDRTLYQKP